MSETAPDHGTQDGLCVPGIMRMSRFEWERCIRRFRLGFYEGKTKDPKRWVRHATVQQVALALATYGDLDGTRVRPSVERMANVCELDERTVRACIQRLRGLNLLELVTPPRSPGRGGGKGRAAEFRMTVPEDILLRVAHLDQDEKKVTVPDGVDVAPPRKSRAKAASPDECLWTTP